MNGRIETSKVYGWVATWTGQMWHQGVRMDRIAQAVAHWEDIPETAVHMTLTEGLELLWDVV